MKRTFFYLAIALFTVTSMICWSMPVSATGTLVYTEDFEDGTADTFTIGEQQQGSMQVVTDGGNHVLQLVTSTGEDENGYFHYIFGPTVGKYFVYKLKYRPDNIKNPDYNTGYIWFRCQKDMDDNGFDEGENEAYGIAVWEWRAAFVVKGFRESRGSTEPVTRAENQDFLFENGTWYNIRIEVRDMNFKLYVDDQLAIDWTETQKTWFTEGNFAFTAWGANVSVDDIWIAEYDSEAALNAGTITTSDSSSASVSKSSSSSSSSKSSSASSSAAVSSEAASASAEESLVSESETESSSEAAVSTTSSEAASESAAASGESSSASDEPAEGGVQTWVYIAGAVALLAIAAGVILMILGKKKK